VTIELLIGVPLGMLYQNERVWFLYGELGISGQLLARLEVFILIALLGFKRSELMSRRERQPARLES